MNLKLALNIKLTNIQVLVKDTMVIWKFCQNLFFPLIYNQVFVKDTEVILKFSRLQYSIKNIVLNLEYGLQVGFFYLKMT